MAFNFAEIFRPPSDESDDDEQLSDYERPEPLVMNNDLIMPIQIYDDAVSTLNRCQTQMVKNLCVWNIGQKLTHSGNYDVGGLYDDKDPEFWFYFTTGVCPGYNYLFNLFVCHRKVGNFSLTINHSKKLHHELMPDGSVESLLLDPKINLPFKSVQANQHHYIYTLSFNDGDLKEIANSTLIIPIFVDTKVNHTFNLDKINKVKIDHNTLISLKQEKTDFVLETTSKKLYNVHKIILAVHSPVFKKMVLDGSSARLDIADNIMDILIDFLYTGHIPNMPRDIYLEVINVAQVYELQNLLEITKLLLSELKSIS